MYSSAKVNSILPTNDEPNDTDIAYELPELSPSPYEYVALRTQYLFDSQNVSIETKPQKLPCTTCTPIFSSTTTTSRIQKTALSRTPKNIWLSIFLSLKRFFRPLSNSIANWLSLSNYSSSPHYARWVHNQIEHKLIMKIAKNMQESKEKIEEEKRISSKKKAILLQEIKKEDDRRELRYYELKKLYLSLYYNASQKV